MSMCCVRICVCELNLVCKALLDCHWCCCCCYRFCYSCCLANIFIQFLISFNFLFFFVSFFLGVCMCQHNSKYMFACVCVFVLSCCATAVWPRILTSVFIGFCIAPTSSPPGATIALIAQRLRCQSQVLLSSFFLLNAATCTVADKMLSVVL